MLETPDSLARPQTYEEIDEALQVQWAIETMRLISADVIPHGCGHGQPIVLVEYEIAPPPQAFWAKWLMTRILPTQGTGWSARLRAYLPETQRLFFTASPDGVDQLLAQIAGQCQPVPSVMEVRLGVLLPKSHFFRVFPLIH